MLTLFHALEAIAPALASTSRHMEPHVMLSATDKMLIAFNGLLCAHVPIELPGLNEDIVLDAQKLKRCWESDSLLKISEKTVSITTRDVRYRLTKIDKNTFVYPPMWKAETPLSVEARAAILMAVKFASENAVHPWACGVTLYNGRAIATNNVSAVSVECDTPLEGTLPFWAIEALRKDKDPPLVSIDDNRLAFEYDDEVMIQATALADKAPTKLFEIVSGITRGTVPTKPYADVYESLFRIGGKHCTLSQELCTVDAENGDQVTCVMPKCDYDEYKVKISASIAELIFTYATHMDFVNTPERLLFTRDIAPRFVGIAAGVI